MIVRTYGRRSRSLNDDVEDQDPFSFREEDELEEEELPFSSFSEEQQQCPESPNRVCNFTFSSQDSTRWNFDSDPPYGPNSNSSENLQLLSPVVDRKSKKLKLDDGRREREREKAKAKAGLRPTATLMETQEYGEMMECVDEVDFALDGLRKGQGVRVRRASLLSLLNVCGTPQQRRLLKAQG